MECCGHELSSQAGAHGVRESGSVRRPPITKGQVTLPHKRPSSFLGGFSESYRAVVSETVFDQGNLQRYIDAGAKFKNNPAQRSCSCPAVAWRALVNSFLYLIPLFSPSISHMERSPSIFLCQIITVFWYPSSGGTEVRGDSKVYATCMTTRFQRVGRAREGQVK